MFKNTTNMPVRKHFIQNSCRKLLQCSGLFHLWTYKKSSCQNWDPKGTLMQFSTLVLLILRRWLEQQFCVWVFWDLWLWTWWILWVIRQSIVRCLCHMWFLWVFHWRLPRQFFWPWKGRRLIQLEVRVGRCFLLQSLIKLRKVSYKL